ncbi:cathepsin L 1 precursor [Micractinium conductrix]|uniref:Cathepsin L 1 n=1 Tax=Micractinium conductrix TaxID=554055 RepID=A0A2P6UZJ0_9CHLO|nr:cathepsin L 1 precursor [Micractinium conductrix]|eukprot:PSC67255.1 cathepsin L 1 precursor [Micractinium conductrix]
MAATSRLAPSLWQAAQARTCITHHRLWTNPELGVANLRVVGPGHPAKARAPLPVVHSDCNTASAGEQPHSPYNQVYGGLWQHGEPHNIVFSDDHSSVTNEVEKLLQVAAELGGSEAVFKVVEQFGGGPESEFSEMNVATALRCLADAAARMKAGEVESKILRHPCFEGLVRAAHRRALHMSDVELGEVARACAALQYPKSAAAAQVHDEALWLELDSGGALRPYNPATTAESRREAAAAASQLADLSSAQKAKLFEDFKQLHGKKYASAAEDRARFAAFQSNLADLVRWNLRPKASFYKGLHRHSDLTFQQFSAARLMPGQPAADLAARAAAGPRFDAARHRRKLAQAAGAVLDLWDWRAQGKVPAVRDQGGCGSCWAFAGLGALEIKALIDGTSAVPDASEQHMVDCCNAAASSASGVPFASTGCDGGFCDDVFTFASQWFAAPEASYPYTATTGTGCPSWATAAPASAPAGSLALTPQPGFQWVAASPYDIMAAVASTGPVTAYFRVEDSFYGYAGGVYPASACTPGELNHAMLVVGYNRTAGVGHPESYFLLRNSWGPCPLCLYGGLGKLPVTVHSL